MKHTNLHCNPQFCNTVTDPYPCSGHNSSGDGNIVNISSNHKLCSKNKLILLFGVSILYKIVTVYKYE